jgi:hypothetical protein
MLVALQWSEPPYKRALAVVSIEIQQTSTIWDINTRILLYHRE